MPVIAMFMDLLARSHLSVESKMEILISGNERCCTRRRRYSSGGVRNNRHSDGLHMVPQTWLGHCQFYYQVESIA
jgi:hypothetical protein